MTLILHTKNRRIEEYSFFQLETGAATVPKAARQFLEFQMVMAKFAMKTLVMLGTTSFYLAFKVSFMTIYHGKKDSTGQFKRMDLGMHSKFRRSS